MWRRDHARQWRDIRLSTYNEFVFAYRQYIAFALDADAIISASPHPYKPDEMMPYFDEAGRPYREKLEATIMAVRLVSARRETADAAKELVDSARRIAAARATRTGQNVPTEFFDRMWQAQHKFMVSARQELGLSNIWQDTEE
ncbi:hypothetical protein DMA12_35275 [Amycolatopsis balhimycina DSM 5908]|uniref:Uncharacterized protein n=1 Tax=Amycolatopsis balhimycina DSM 5908 TaxID=1081091 RepID=A0A428W480_AMYBA|nr:hypothetical protein DMA12_35275 [Amycolatopsis balhimycina DSM 5908]